MPKLTIDKREVEVPPGATILDAARKLGIDIPTLCHLKGYAPSTSCLVCMVKVGGTGRLVPSCATVAVDGMEIESETEEVHQVRRSALELLLSDHLGDCLAPCYFGCPAHMDIPLMLRQIASGNIRDAIVTVKNDIALPAVLGRICPAPCEKVCRRTPAGGAVAICGLKRFVADADLALSASDGDDPYLPPCRPDSGKRVAILGAGPTGLSAVYYLRQHGHACTLFDENMKPGGRVRQDTGEDQLPRNVLDAEIEQILRLGVELCMEIRVEGKQAIADLRNEFDAILIACGSTAGEQAEAWGLPSGSRGVAVDKQTFYTEVTGVFAAGGAIRAKGPVIRSVADGKQAAVSIDQYLADRTVIAPTPAFNTKIGRLQPEELSQMLACVSEGGTERTSREAPAAGFEPAEAVAQAIRCMHCDCRKLGPCKLRKYSARYNADPRRYHTQRGRLVINRQHASVIYEPGKCIACGLCIEIAQAADEPLGLTFVGRGFDVRVAVPLDGSMDEALGQVAAECIAACPTAALSSTP